MKIETAYFIVARRNGLSRKHARRLFPKVLAHAMEHFQVVRDAVRAELAAAVERICQIEATVADAMARFDITAARLLA